MLPCPHGNQQMHHQVNISCKKQDQNSIPVTYLDYFIWAKSHHKTTVKYVMKTLASILSYKQKMESNVLTSQVKLSLKEHAIMQAFPLHKESIIQSLYS